ncbi:HAD-IIIC family phosphatase [Bradyrhizobium sp. WSM3983]|uniref:HAD-IIIC family phosphatase n=1 Tax=Bradyrhizobium sp. WSM3983 TaxID=1038867 RepID=UPI00041F9B12|nr:HAD-IIIC family phosphatase [Bradyrhizobium sp. WSM3983]
MAQKTDQTRSVVIAATFTAEPLQPSLEFLFEKIGLRLDVRFSPYHQVLQELISTSSTLANLDKGVAVILVRLEDFIRDINDHSRALETISSIAGEIASSLAAFAARAKSPAVLSVLAASPEVPEQLRVAIEKATEQLVERVTGLSGLTVLHPRDIDVVAGSDRFDRESDRLAHVPFTEDHYASLSLAIARKVHAFLVPDRKVLVLDCDNTLWRGVVGEDGVDGIAIPPSFAYLQKFALGLQAQGVLICLASKNVERDVLDVLEQRRDMLLKPEHIVAHRINWNPKPQNLADIAQTLNLGLDSFVFLDDNPVECELMKAELPQVLTLLLPPEDQIEAFLDHLWAFDKVAVTEEDKRRTSLYKEDAARKALEKDATNIVDFVASLEVKVDVDPPGEGDWPRLAQLTQRTNQFNFTTVRRTESELRTLVDGSPNRAGQVLKVKVSDRFGDYGLVGLVICVEADRKLLVDTFLLSCRVLGRGVEHAILRYLAAIAKSRGFETVSLPFDKTARNEPASAFADSVAEAFKGAEGDRTVYRIPTHVALEIHHRPGFDPDAVIKARESDGKKPSVQVTTANVSERYTIVSQALLTGKDVLSALSKSNVRHRALPGTAALPATEAERHMLAIWEEVLGIEGLGIDDDYTDAGGTSLLAARLFALVSQRFGVRLPLTFILEHPTVRRLTAVVNQDRSQISSLVELRSGGRHNFFFVHDGDGETLLYQNIARRLPEGFNAYGIEPRQLQNIPLAHVSIEDMATHYLDLIREKQPVGPYFVGGMCAGGVIAFEIARQLTKADQQVGLVALLDSALPGTPRRRGRIAKQRANRVAELLSGHPEQRGGLAAKAAMLCRKAFNAATWEVSNRMGRLSVKARFEFLRHALRRGIAWPGLMPALTVRQIYDSAESSYSPAPTSLPGLMLVRARAGQGGDTPFREVYADDELGWRRVSTDLLIEDVDGGHYTMLQEPFAEAVAEKIAVVLDGNSGVATPPAYFKATA